MSPTFRFGLFYSTMFLLLGVALPFLPVWLEFRGLSEVAIGATLAIAYSGRAVFAAIIAYLADSRLDQKSAIFVSSAATCALFVASKFVGAGVSLAIITILALWFYLVTLPLVDVAALRIEQQGRLQYARVRAIGSAAFIFATLVGGFAIESSSRESIIVWIAASAAAMMFAASVLPKSPKPTQKKGRLAVSLRGVGRYLITRRFLIFIFGISLVQASHAVYYGFSAIEWSRQGHSDVTIGALWSIGVAAEIILLYYGAYLTKRYRPWIFLSFGGVGAVVRWTVIGMAPPLALLFFVQISHALTFGATHLATLYFIRRNTPAYLANTAMTVSTSVIGLISGAASFAAGILYGKLGVTAFYAMAVLGGLGLLSALACRKQARLKATP